MLVKKEKKMDKRDDKEEEEKKEKMLIETKTKKNKKVRLGIKTSNFTTMLSTVDDIKFLLMTRIKI